MFNSPFNNIAPNSTPKAIKVLILLNIAISCFTALFTYLFTYDISFFFGLSLIGIKKGFFWQLITYLFLIPSNGFSTGFFIRLAFKMYMLWVFGVSLTEKTSTKKFLIFFFASGILSGICSLFFMSLQATPYLLFGSTTIIYTYLVAWIFLNPNSVLRLFFTIPINAKWLILGTLGFNLLIDISHGDFILLGTNVIAAFWGWIFSLYIRKIRNPFSFLFKLEKKYKTLLERHKKKTLHKTEKHFFNDEQFLNAMLEKISLNGEKSLTKKEKMRMQKISEKRKNHP